MCSSVGPPQIEIPFNQTTIIVIAIIGLLILSEILFLRYNHKHGLSPYKKYLIQTFIIFGTPILAGGLGYVSYIMINTAIEKINKEGRLSYADPCAEWARKQFKDFQAKPNAGE